MDSTKALQKSDGDCMNSVDFVDLVIGEQGGHVEHRPCLHFTVLP